MGGFAVCLLMVCRTDKRKYPQLRLILGFHKPSLLIGHPDVAIVISNGSNGYQIIKSIFVSLRRPVMGFINRRTIAIVSLGPLIQP